jgi:hypothetical protein
MPNPKLIIDYLLDGEQRGYAFTTPTNHLDPRTVKTLWRQAMPRGQGWGAYNDARSLKVIPLENGRIAVSEVTVTDRRDELGRQGLRRAEITLLNSHEYDTFLRERWQATPADVRTAADRKAGFRLWKRLADMAIPRMRGEPQLILAYPYANTTQWRVIEALMLKLMLTPTLRFVRGLGFTTLALDHREESPVVALPLDKARLVKPGKGVAVIDLS